MHQTTGIVVLVFVSLLATKHTLAKTRQENVYLDVQHTVHSLKLRIIFVWQGAPILLSVTLQKELPIHVWKQ